MSFSSLLKRVWGHPLGMNIDINGADTVVIHHEIIQSKPLLQEVYRKWYHEFLNAYKESENIGGDLLEIGCGSGFLEEIIPGLIKTDVVPTPFTHQVVDAMKLDFDDEQLRAIFMVHVLHHIQYPVRFFAEAQRCLRPGGRLVMVEPSNGFLQRFMAKWTDHFEYYDDTVFKWENRSSERMTDANMALPWVIFERDRLQFEKEFSFLKIVDVRYHTFLSYFVSGGFGYRSFLPSFFLPLIHGIEWLAKPFMSFLGTAMTIDIVKVEPSK